MHERRRGGIVGPLILIVVGVIFLLQQMGLVAADIWLRLVGLWPLILIAIGIDLVLASLIGRSRIGAVLSLILIAIVFGAGLIWAVNGSAFGLGKGGLSRQSVNQPVAGAKSAVVSIALGDGELRLHSASEPGELLSGSIELRGGRGRLTQSFQEDGGVAHLTLQEQGSTWVMSGWEPRRLWDLGLSPDLALELSAKVGAGNLSLDASGLQVRAVEVDCGVGQVRITLPGRGDYSARVHAGVGDVWVYVPEGLAARIHAHAGLGSASVAGAYSKRSDGEWLSPGYDTAANRVELTVDSGIGSVRVLPGKGE